MGHLDGFRVVITGAGRGIGAAYARAAADAGAAVVVNDIDSVAAADVTDEIRDAGGTAVAHAGDVSDADAAEGLIERCVAEFGEITGLVNNAALCVSESFQTSSVENLRALLEVNVVGVYNCARAAIGPMLEQVRGSIVNITSGAHSGQPGLSTYGATKGAVASFTYGWAEDLAGTRVRVNAVSPVGSTLMSNFRADLPDPARNAPAVLFLLSDLSANVHGQIVRINDNRLSLMCHPANRSPVLEREEWTLDSVAAAFDETLAANQLPTNIATYDVASVEVGGSPTQGTNAR